MTLRLIRQRRAPLYMPAFYLAAFAASLRLARKHPAMEREYCLAAYGFLAERIRLEERAKGGGQ